MQADVVLDPLWRGRDQSLDQRGRHVDNSSRTIPEVKAVRPHTLRVACRILLEGGVPVDR